MPWSDFASTLEVILSYSMYLSFWLTGEAVARGTERHGRLEKKTEK
jgi:hypothetical protein